MAKYIINKGYNDEKTVEGADSVRQVDGFFYFQDTAKKSVFIHNASKVLSIQRVASQ